MLVEVLLERTMEVHYGFLILSSAQTTDDADTERDAWRGQINGLVGAAIPEMLRIRTETHTGPVGVLIELHDEAPPEPGDEWTEVVEVAYASWVDDLVLSSFDQYARAIPLPPGAYQVRYAGRPGEGHGRPGEQCRLQFWPAAGVDRVVRQTSPTAAYRHRTSTVEPWTADELRSRVEAMRNAEDEDDEREELPPGAGHEYLLRGLGAHGRQVGAIDPVYTAHLTAADPATFRAIALWAAEQALTMTGIRDRPEIDGALSAARRGDPVRPDLVPMPEFGNVEDPWRAFTKYQAAELLVQAAGPLDMETTCSILLSAGRTNRDHPDWMIAAVRRLFPLG